MGGWACPDTTALCIVRAGGIGGAGEALALPIFGRYIKLIPIKLYIRFSFFCYSLHPQYFRPSSGTDLHMNMDKYYIL